MPKYIFRCEQCDGELERFLRYADYDEHIEICPVCGKRMHRVVRDTAVIYKGDGWTRGKDECLKGRPHTPKASVEEGL